MATTKLVLTLSVLLLEAAMGHIHGPQSQCSPWPPAFMADNCKGPDASKFMYEITSHRNKTGHWVTKVNFEVMHGANLQQGPGLGLLAVLMYQLT
jgi:hypothetical protein